MLVSLMTFSCMASSIQTRQSLTSLKNVLRMTPMRTSPKNDDCCELVHLQWYRSWAGPTRLSSQLRFVCLISGVPEAPHDPAPVQAWPVFLRSRFRYARNLGLQWPFYALYARSDSHACNSYGRGACTTRMYGGSTNMLDPTMRWSTEKLRTTSRPTLLRRPIDFAPAQRIERCCDRAPRESPGWQSPH